MTRTRQKKQEQHMLSDINMPKKKKKRRKVGGGHKIYNNITYIIDQTGKRDGERNATLLRTCAIDSKDMKVN